MNINTVPRDLAHSIKDIALEIEAQTGGEAVILGLEHRTRPRGLSAEDYCKIKNGVNRWLRRVLPETKKRFEPIGVRRDELDFDGVHLNTTATGELFERIVRIARDRFVAKLEEV